LNKIVSQLAHFGRNNTTFLPSCHSTNSYALEWLKEHEVQEGWMVYTFDQTNGRGQGGNKWESTPHHNLTFSLVYCPTFLKPKDQFQLNKAVSLGLVAYLNAQGFDAQIKWPNDIYLEGGKVAGILIENILRGNDFRYAVVGVGLNVNQKQFSVPAVSLFLMDGKERDLETSLVGLASCIDLKMNHLASGDMAEIDIEYHKVLYRRNQPAFYSSGGEHFAGVVKGVDETGRLRVLTENGERTFALKEISFL
jgi:BirA family transcriptional regulator, biotin operon repressor / biotin---[acetyl-CoA-carboxylase] ligase